MKNAEIYYFTGTGNSLFIVKELKEHLGEAELVPIASLRNDREVEVTSELAGIVFPVYYGNPPNIVKRFVKKLVVPKETYLFALCTYGGSSGRTLKVIKQLFSSRGIQLSAGFDIHMPQNSFQSSLVNIEKLYSKSRKRVEKISKKIDSRKKGISHSDHVLRTLFFPFYGLMEKSMVRFLEKTSKTPSSSEHTIEELIPMIDNNYRTDENCDGCGLCVRICPVDNIEIVDGEPIWKNHCENCLACYNFCPNHAIKGGMMTEDYYYHHPELKVSDLVKQRVKT